MQPENTTLQKAAIGIDVSKLTLDVALLTANGKIKSRVFDNDGPGFRKMLSWAQHTCVDCQLHFCLEATGSYSEAVAIFLVEAEQFVSVINPARIHYFGLALGTGNKTDKAAAQLIALYCQKEAPPLWRMASPAVRRLKALVRLLQDLVEMRTMQLNRLQTPGLDAIVTRIIRKHLRQLEGDIADAQAAIEDHIKNTPSLKEDRDLLVSIPGLGDTLARVIMAELPDVSQFDNAQSVGAYSGMAPSESRSGTSVKKKTRMSKRGNARLRAALYLPAMSAIQHNPIIKTFYERLVGRGMPRMAALGAAMRKLLMLAYGVLKSRKVFDADWVQTRTASAEA
jgi:transposase